MQEDDDLARLASCSSQHNALAPVCLNLKERRRASRRSASCSSCASQAISPAIAELSQAVDLELTQKRCCYVNPEFAES
jgi:hypothetical protein